MRPPASRGFDAAYGGACRRACRGARNRPRGDLRVEARKATVAEVLAALKQQHDLSVRGAAANRVVNGTFAGSLHYVLERVLDGYDYVIEHNGGALDVIVLSDGTPHAAQAAQPIVVVKRRAD